VSHDRHAVDANDALVETALYGAEEARAYLDGAPHLKHPSLRTLLENAVTDLFTRIDRVSPRVLDLGAGEGSATLVFLDHGARVTAVDDSDAQLAVLRERAASRPGRIDILQGRVDDVLRERSNDRYDVVAAVSFLHHVPDYVALVRDATALVAPGGAFFSFQDPLLHERLPRSTHTFQRAAYAAWRVRKGDVAGGLRRRARRARGTWDETCTQDVIEYHATRSGVDEEEVCVALRHAGFEPRLIRYFSTQSAAFQRVGSALGLENTFAITAVRRDERRSSSP
jgi:2-polyprenyl-3-methyl-5-hydroxy-6-metoxy-1,4-benzoquinol methylase